MEKRTKMILGALAILFAIVFFVVLLVILYLKFWKTTDDVSTFSSYKGIDSYLNVDPFVNFYKQNSLLVDEWYTGNITIDKVSVVYASFLKLVNSGKVSNAPTKIVEEVNNVASFIASGQDFTSVATESFRRLGQALVNINRLTTLYLEGLKFSKDKMGGRDPNAAKLFDDYQRVDAAEDGYIKQFLNNAQVENWATNDKNADKYREDIADELVISSMLNNIDPRVQNSREHDYQEYWDNKHSGSKHSSAKAVYDRIDKRFPGTFDRRILDDDSYNTYDKDAKDPNVPRPGILGRVADEPYMHDVYANNYIRQI